MTSPEFHRTHSWIPSPLSKFHDVERTNTTSAHYEHKSQARSKMHTKREEHNSRLDMLMKGIPHKGALWAQWDDLDMEKLEPVVYAIGGSDAPNMSLVAHKSAEILRGNGTWKTVPSMALPRLDASAVNVDDQLYVIGGFTLGTPPDPKKKHTVTSMSQLIEKLDKNGDGNIVATEFKNRMTDGHQKHELREIFDAVGMDWREVFDAIDTDGDGQLSVKEMETYLKDKLYEGMIVDEQRRTRRGEMFDPETCDWYPIKAMETRRSRHGLAAPYKKNEVGLWVQSREIFAVGGYGGPEIGNEVALASVEKYIIDSDSWESMPPLATARYGHACAAVEGVVVSIGGMGAEGEVLSSVECFNTFLGRYAPARPEVGPLADMPTARAMPACAVMRDQIYVCGGFTGQDHIATVERLNPLSGSWSTCAPMKYARSSAAATVLDDILYVMGGYDGEERLSAVEAYNYIDDTWTEVASMSCPRAALAAAVCNRPTPQLPAQTAEWEAKVFTDRYNRNQHEKAAIIFAPKCHVTCNGGAEAGGQGPFTTPEEATGFLSYLHNAMGAEALKITVSSVYGLSHEDVWESSHGKGTSKAEWKQVGGADTIDDEDDDAWKIVKLELTWEEPPEASAE